MRKTAKMGVRSAGFTHTKEEVAAKKVLLSMAYKKVF